MMTAEQLDLSPELHNALIRVLNGLESGKLRHGGRYPHSEARMVFNMGIVAEPIGESCGTVACIGGWAYALMHGTKKDGIWQFDHDAAGDFLYELPSETQLNELFYPGRLSGYCDGYDYDAITSKQAAEALRNYLTTGFPKWTEILGNTHAERCCR